MPAPAPLRGITVLDLTRHLPGPLATRLLADLGARVIKVEEPEHGDPVREVPPFVGGRSALAALLLAGHESIALDLKRQAGVDVLRSLLADADLLVETFRPGGMARFGLAPDDLRRRFPRLVVCSLSGWGQDGPYVDRPGHDLTYLAVAGALAPTGEHPPVPVADLVGAWSAVSSAVAALYERERTGEGRWIDLALGDVAVHANVTNWAMEAGGPREVGEPVPLSGALPCYGIYGTADGKRLAIGCLEPHFWRRFCHLASREDLFRRQYDTTETTRRAVADLVATKTLEEWTELCRGHDVPVEPVLPAAEALRHPQVESRGVARQLEDGSYRLRYPAKLDGERPEAPGDLLPAIGGDTRSVLEKRGIGAEARSDRQLRKDGVGPRRTLGTRIRRWLPRWPRRIVR